MADKITDKKSAEIENWISRGLEMISTLFYDPYLCRLKKGLPMDNGKIFSKYFMFFLFFVMFCFSSICWGTTYYVSPAGSDANPGTMEKPFRSLSFVANKKVHPGDTVIALDGIYYDTDQGKDEAILYIRKGGTFGKKVVFKALNPGKAVLDGKNTVKYGICVAPGADYLTIEGFEIRRCWHWGISTAGSYIVIKNNNIHDNGLTCPADYPNGEGGIYTNTHASHIGIDSNKIYHNGRLNLTVHDKNGNKDHGIYLCSSNSSITNNLIYGNQAFGIQVCGSKSAENTIISNNTICNEKNRGGIVLWLKGTKNCIIQNNIIFNNHGYAWAIEFLHDGGHHIIRNNIFFNNPSGVFNKYTSPGNSIIHNMVTDPMLNDSYMPTAGSPAINKGYIDGAPNHDIEGKSRNSIDIGCYEYKKGKINLNPPTNIHTVSILY